MRNLLSLSYIMKCALDILFLYFIFQHKEKFKTFFGNPFNLLKIFVISLIIIVTAVKLSFFGEILSPADIKELNVCEGICYVEGGTKYNKIFINGERFYFGIMGAGKNNNFYFYNKLNSKNVKVWYKGEQFNQVYQLEIEGKIIYSLSEANEDVTIHNIHIITVPYMWIILLVTVGLLERWED